MFMKMPMIFDDIAGCLRTPAGGLTKSKQRVADHGEVFTPSWLVEKVLDLVKGETERIDSRFLEPSCGSGNFLVPILQRKLAAVELKYGKSDFEKRHYALVGLTCCYGIELLADNIAECRANMLEVFAAYLNLEEVDELYRAAAHVLSLNLIHGDATTMRSTVQMAIKKGVAIGAHPSFPDLQGFGRREMSLSSDEIFDIVLYQVSALKGICEAFGTKLHHVKPHGALYNVAAKDEKVAMAIAQAVKKIDTNLIFYGLSGSFLIAEAEKIGLKTASEVFADRTYTDKGFLTPRNQPNALIDSTEKSLNQVMQMIKEKSVTATDGQNLNIKTETICIHGDGSHALEFARAIRLRLINENVEIKTL